MDQSVKPRWKAEANINNAIDCPKSKSKNRLKFWKSKDGKEKNEKVNENSKQKPKTDFVETLLQSEVSKDIVTQQNSCFCEDIFNFKKRMGDYLKKHGFYDDEELHNLGAFSEDLHTVDLNELSEIIEIIIDESAAAIGNILCAY